MVLVIVVLLSYWRLITICEPGSKLCSCNKSTSIQKYSNALDDKVLQHKTMILTTCPRDGFTKFSATAPLFQDIIVKMLDDADVNDAGGNSMQGHSTRDAVIWLLLL